MTNKEIKFLTYLRNLFIRIIIACIIFLCVFLLRQYDSEILGISSSDICKYISSSIIPNTII